MFPALARVASPADARWKPPPSEKHPKGGGSILEICVHMLFEEVEDFRARIMHLHSDPAAPWPISVRGLQNASMRLVGVVVKNCVSGPWP